MHTTDRGPLAKGVAWLWLKSTKKFGIPFSVAMIVAILAVPLSVVAGAASDKTACAGFDIHGSAFPCQLFKDVSSGAGTAFATAHMTVDAAGNQVFSQAPGTGSNSTLNPNPVPAVAVEGTKATFRSCATAQAVQATPQDIAYLDGSATRTVRLLEVDFAATSATALSSLDVSIIRRGFPYGAGAAGATPTALPALANDTGNATAATGGVSNQLALATPNATVTVTGGLGTIATSKYTSQLPGTTASASQLVMKFGVANGQSAVLHGTNQELALNLGGATLGGVTTADYCFEWSEE